MGMGISLNCLGFPHSAGRMYDPYPKFPSPKTSQGRNPPLYLSPPVNKREEGCGVGGFLWVDFLLLSVLVLIFRIIKFDPLC